MLFAVLVVWLFSLKDFRHIPGPRKLHLQLFLIEIFLFQIFKWLLQFFPEVPPTGYIWSSLLITLFKTAISQPFLSSVVLLPTALIKYTLFSLKMRSPKKTTVTQTQWGVELRSTLFTPEFPVLKSMPMTWIALKIYLRNSCVYE